MPKQYNVGDKVVYRDTDGKLHRNCVVLSDNGESLVLEGSVNFYKYTDVRRQHSHLSPTGLALFEKNTAEFYMKYCTFNRAPREPQTQPMSVGSAFDAYVKSYILERIKGKGAVPNSHQFETLFINQVEPHNRDWAREHGKICFDAYKLSGALADLMLEICQADKEPIFEFEVKGIVKHKLLGADFEVPITGRPDMYFHNKEDARVVGDWKVNGYCANQAQSPRPQYVLCRDGWIGEQSRSHRRIHKDAQPMNDRGIMVNASCSMEDIDQGWATQLCTYAWLLGETVGSDFISALEQLACDPLKKQIRVASFRNLISSDYQNSVMARYVQAWSRINSDHYFPELSLEESVLKCAHLENVAKDLWPTGDEKEDWLRRIR